MEFAEPSGDAQKQRQRKATIVTFIPADVGLNLPNGSAQAAKIGIDGYIEPQSNANKPAFYIDGAATAGSFLKALPGLVDLLGFTGHSIDFSRQPSGQIYSVGLNFYQNVTCISSVANALCTEGGPHATVATSPPSGAQVIFIGSCFIGPEFLNLWNPNPKQALVVPLNPTSSADLYHATLYYEYLVTDLLGGAKLEKAVQDASQEMEDHGFADHWRIIGNGEITSP